MAGRRTSSRTSRECRWRSSAIRLARPRGILAPGLAARAVFWVCHQIAGRPRASVKTNWERDREGRSSTRSIAAPGRRQRSTGASSSRPALSSQRVASWAQKTRVARGQVSRALRTRPPSMGSQIRYGRRLSGSGFSATRKRGLLSNRPASIERSIRSGCHRLAEVLAEQTAKPHPPSHVASYRGDWITSGRGWSQTATSMWPLVVVVCRVDIENLCR